uniref:SLAM family member 8-like n=1 Tax=Geotrypetes seraphini TaxID=260995 RepID=A0A6P8PYG2_GEOSA|nr:SLAM family member 8-like [Geotrypetes seraphini]
MKPKCFRRDPARSGFGFGLLWGIILFPDLPSVIIQAQNLSPPLHPSPRWVNGILGGFVLFSIDVNPEYHIDKIEWLFGFGTSRILGESQRRTFNESKFTNKFHQRLQMYNETTLRIDGLKMEDKGIFEAHIRITGYVLKQNFHLTVYDPVPTPEIRILNSSNDSLTVTLECLVLSHAAVNITWIEGTLPAHLEELHQPWRTLNRSSLNISVNCSTEDRVLFCVVSNPADMKNASINMSSACPRKGEIPVPRTLWYVLLPIAFIAFIVIPLIFFYWKKIKMKSKGSAPRRQIPEGSSAVEYAEIQRISPEENDPNNANLKTNPLALKPQPPNEQTVYDVVRYVPEERSKEVI